MSRDLPSGLATAAAAPHVTHFVLLEIELDGGSIYLASAPHSVDYGGNTYQAAAGIGTIEPLEEIDGVARGLTFTLSLVSEAAIASALTEHVQGRAVTLRWAAITAAGLQVEPTTWRGYMDVQTIEDGAAPVLRVTAEHAMIRWDQAPGILFSHADQLEVDAADLFFEHAAAMVDKTISWPSKEFFRQ